MSKKISDILFIFNGPLTNSISGGDQHAIMLANYLVNKGYNVSAILPINTYEEKLNKKIVLLTYFDLINNRIL